MRSQRPPSNSHTSPASEQPLRSPVPIELERERILARFEEHSARFDAIASQRRPGQRIRLLAARTEPAPRTPTKREIQVLQLVANGLSNREIASQLVITEETAKSHVRHLLIKLKALSRAHAVAIGFRSRLVS